MAQRILQSNHLFIGDGSSIENGMLRIDENGKIQEIGRDIASKGEVVEIMQGGLSPAFVNTHCHLELSHLHTKIEMHQGLHEFIPSLQKQRAATELEKEAAIRDWDKKMYAEGIKAVGDISNSADTLQTKKESSIFYHSFIELFGLREAKSVEIFEKGIKLLSTYQEAALSASIAPHSPYSVSDSLFKSMQELHQNKPISIHNQESEGEMEMFERKSGSLKEMLMNFGNVENEIDKDASSSLAHALQFIDPNQKLLLVHNTFTNADDIDRAAESHSNLYWCFCPNANWYIEKRLPNIPLFLQKGVKCTLGTDSLASNHELSILSEMKLIQSHYPEISTETMVEWASKNGAEFLGVSQLGAFEVGKKVGLNHISNLGREGELTEQSTVKVIY